MRYVTFDPAIQKRWDYIKFLAEVNQIEVNSIVEVGTWEGKNALKLREFFPEARLTLIDPWLPTKEYMNFGVPAARKTCRYEEAYRNVVGLFEKDPLTTILRCTSLEGSHRISDTHDIIFIDADHSYEHVKQDISIWKDKVRPGGLLAGHDYRPDFLEVRRAVEESFPKQFFVGVDSVWGHIKCFA